MDNYTDLDVIHRDTEDETEDYCGDNFDDPVHHADDSDSESEEEDSDDEDSDDVDSDDGDSDDEDSDEAMTNHINSRKAQVAIRRIQ